MPVIYHRDYRIIRNKLNSDNPKIIKNGIQEILHLIETGHRFVGGAKDDKVDFLAFIIELLQHPDYDIRKWLYHLLCLCPLEAYKEKLTECCLENIPLELSENNIENISWITAVCGVNCEDVVSFESIIRLHSLNEYLSLEQIRLSSSAFRIEPFYEINRNRIMTALDALDSISPIWLTKMYANQYIPLMKKRAYMKKHGEISTEAFITLLSHPESEVGKYAMWAFAQEPGGNMNSILQYVPLSQIQTMEAGIQKWYFVKMFQDHVFLKEHTDFVQEVGYKLHSFPTNVREGILIGCSKLGYSEVLNDLILDWEQDDWEKSENIQLMLYEYIITNAEKNEDFVEVFKAAYRNVDDLEIPSVQSYIKQYIGSLSEDKSAMSNTSFDIYANNFQYNIGDNNIQLNNSVCEPVVRLRQNDDTNSLKADIETLISKINHEYELSDTKLDILTAHLTYAMKELRESTSNMYVNELKELNDKITELNSVSSKQRGEKLGELLSITLKIASMPVTTPQLIEMVINVIQYVGKL